MPTKLATAPLSVRPAQKAVSAAPGSNGCRGEPDQLPPLIGGRKATSAPAGERGVAAHDAPCRPPPARRGRPAPRRARRPRLPSSAFRPHRLAGGGSKLRSRQPATSPGGRRAAPAPSLSRRWSTCAAPPPGRAPRSMWKSWPLRLGVHRRADRAITSSSSSAPARITARRSAASSRPRQVCSVPVQVSRTRLQRFAEVVAERGDEAEPPAGLGHAHIARRPAGGERQVGAGSSSSPARAARRPATGTGRCGRPRPRPSAWSRSASCPCPRRAPTGSARGSRRRCRAPAPRC